VAGTSIFGGFRGIGFRGRDGRPGRFLGIRGRRLGRRPRHPPGAAPRVEEGCHQ